MDTKIFENQLRRLRTRAKRLDAVIRYDRRQQEYLLIDANSNALITGGSLEQIDLWIQDMEEDKV